MDYNPDMLSALLNLLVENGAEEFEGYGIHVRFNSGCFSEKVEADPVPVLTIQERDVRGAEDVPSLWKSPELWPGGVPAQFPGSKDKK